MMRNTTLLFLMVHGANALILRQQTEHLPLGSNKSAMNLPPVGHQAKYQLNGSALDPYNGGNWNKSAMIQQQNDQSGIGDDVAAGITTNITKAGDQSIFLAMIRLYYNTVAPAGVNWCVVDATGSCSYSFTASDEVCYEAATNARIDYLDMVYRESMKHPALGKTLYLDAQNYATWALQSCEVRGFHTDKKPHPCMAHALTAFKSPDAQAKWRKDRQESTDEYCKKEKFVKCVNVTDYMLTGQCATGM